METDPIGRGLQVAGNNHRYQIILISILCLLFLIGVLPILGPSFYYMDPIFTCKGSDDIIDQKNACPKIQQCKLINNYTIVAELGLYCDRQDQRDLIQAFLSVGSMLGLLLMNFYSDIKGRKQALIVSLVLSILGISFTIIGVYTKYIPSLVIGAFLSGYGGYSAFIISYIIIGQFCNDELRQKAALIVNIAYSLGLVTFDVFYRWIQQWYNITILFTLIPFCGLILITQIIVLQSPFYLFTINKKSEATQVLKTIAAYNKKNQDNSINSIMNSVDQSPNKVQLSQTIKKFFVTFKNPIYLRIIILTALTEAGGNLFYFGIQFAIDDIGYDYGTDNLVLGLTEIVTTLVLTKLVTSLPRKKSIIVSYTLVGLSSFLFMIPLISQSSLLCTFIIIFNRILTTLAYYMIVMIQTQSFPPEIQSVGAGSIQALSQMGSIFAPLIITTAVNLSLNKMAAMGFITILLTVCIIFVPEPKRQLSKNRDPEDSLLNSQIQ